MRTSIRSGSDKFRARQPGWRRYGALSEQSLDARNENVPKRSLPKKISRLMLGRLLFFLGSLMQTTRMEFA
jgi:hypothetical protein